MKEIIFVGDPMCSWCYGFAPVLERLRNQYDASYSLLVGGLRSSGDQPWDERFKKYLHTHWKEIGHKTGQPFDYSLFDREHFDYDTYKACKAVVAVRLIDETKVFAYFHALQQAFYVKGEDITSELEQLKIAQNLGLSEKGFINTLHSPECEKAMHNEFSKARMLGANVFPSLVVIDEAGHLNTIKGCRDFETLVRLLD